jgi:hypothetical protein
MLALREQPAHRRERPAMNVRPADPSAVARDGESTPLLALAGGALDGRFRSWRGASGQRYIFSVYDRQSCPAYEHAVTMIATVEPDGERRIIFVGDTGCFPDILLANAARKSPADREIEFHVHLLATSRAQRSAVVADLVQARRS